MLTLISTFLIFIDLVFEHSRSSKIWKVHSETSVKSLLFCSLQPSICLPYRPLVLSISYISSKLFHIYTSKHIFFLFSSFIYTQVTYYIHCPCPVYFTVICLRDHCTLIRKEEGTLIFLWLHSILLQRCTLILFNQTLLVITYLSIPSPLPWERLCVGTSWQRPGWESTMCCFPQQLPRSPHSLASGG